MLTNTKTGTKFNVEGSQVSWYLLGEHNMENGLCAIYNAYHVHLNHINHGHFVAMSNGYADNLMHCAADVVIKKQKKLILVPRENTLFSHPFGEYA